MNLKRLIVVGSLWSLAGNGMQQVISLLLFIYIARKLTPADFGLVALAMVFIEVLSFASRWGQVEVLQRAKILASETISTSFWMLAVSGVVVSAAIGATAEISARLYTEPLLEQVLLLLAPISALRALSAIPEAMLKRRFDFRSLAVRGWLGTLIGGVVGGYLAYHGFGVYALVGQRVSATFVQAITGWSLLRWHPQLHFSIHEAGRLAREGVQVMAAGFSGVLSLRIAETITGLVLGPAELGFLRLGWRFFDLTRQMTVQPITTVALGTFSRLADDRDALRRTVLRFIQFMSLASLPILFGLGAIADTFVPVVFGHKWAGAIVVMQLIGFIWLPAPLNFIFATVMIAIGKTRVLLRQSVMQVFATVILVSLGCFFGIAGVTIAVIIRSTLLALYSIYHLKKEINVDQKAIVRVLLPSAAACGVMVTTVEIMQFELSGRLAPVALLAASVIAGAISYIAVLVLGDIVGLWRGFVRGSVDSLVNALAHRRTANVVPSV